MAIYLKTVNLDAPVEVPVDSLRWDVAWKLFLPQHIGDIPAGFPDMTLSRLTAWAWESLGTMAGRMRIDRADPVWFLVPPLTPAAEEYVARIASFWDDEVYRVSDAGEPVGDNLWLPPVVSIYEKSAAGPLDQAVGALRHGSRDYRIFFPHLGLGRLHVMLMTVETGKASTRLHSHSAVDEYYLIVSGKGTLRMGTHSMSVEAGNLIGKPSGPDLTSQILADRGEPVTILDIEAWPDRQDTKDVMYYSDFGEIQLHGAGWSAVISDEALHSATDKGRHYEDGYRRNLDGTWTSRDIPGAPARQED
ncbi:cupin domain-containing protein [Paenibacillus alkalitolerans]|uniref:cupin domain-containing protein n=1 Tax=Paenibacillus alkalitolerans TaxID=2799335 RepID=UPI0018F6574A|nr:cupin domain-containing protein [Paenibacillus alkalitolerans]